MYDPLLVRTMALMAFFPNFAQRMFLHVAGVAFRLLKFLLVAFAQREICAGVTVWMIAPLSIQFAKLFSIAGVGRPRFAGPDVCLNSVWNDWILLAKMVLQPL